MTATTTTIAPSTDRAERPATTSSSLWRPGLTAGLAAAAATTGVVVVARALGVPVETAAGESIPIAGFAQLTLFFTVIGILLAKGIARRADQPRSTFTRTTVALTVLSLVPDLMLSTGAASKLTLMVTHVVAAAVIIPALASRVAEQRTR